MDKGRSGAKSEGGRRVKTDLHVLVEDEHGVDHRQLQGHQQQHQQLVDNHQHARRETAVHVEQLVLYGHVAQPRDEAQVHAGQGDTDASSDQEGTAVSGRWVWCGAVWCGVVWYGVVGWGVSDR